MSFDRLNRNGTAKPPGDRKGARHKLTGKSVLAVRRRGRYRGVEGTDMPGIIGDEVRLRIQVNGGLQTEVGRQLKVSFRKNILHLIPNT